MTAAPVFFPHRGIAGDWHVCTRDADGAIVSVSEGHDAVDAGVAALDLNILGRPAVVQFDRRSGRYIKMEVVTAGPRWEVVKR